METTELADMTERSKYLISLSVPLPSSHPQSYHLRLAGESLENVHTSSTQYKRDCSLLPLQWRYPIPMSAKLDSTQVREKTLAGVASGMFNCRRGGVGDLPPLAIGRSTRFRSIVETMFDRTGGEFRENPRLEAVTTEREKTRQ